MLLGRGLLPKDEAFVIGFTMGAAQVSAIQKSIFKFVSKFLYPDGYRFAAQDLNIFENGAHCAEIIDCSDISKVDLTQYTGYTIENARRELGIDVGSVRHIVQLRSPRSVDRILQRVGRADHRLGGIGAGDLLSWESDDIAESSVIARRALAGASRRLSYSLMNVKFGYCRGRRRRLTGF